MLSDLLTPIDQAPPHSGPALFLEYARRGKPGAWRYPVVILAAILLAMALALVLGVVLTLAGVLKPDTAAALQDPRQTGPYFSMVATTFGLLLIGVWAAARLIQGKRFGDLVGRWRWSLAGLGFGAWLVVLILGALADFLLHPAGFTFSADGRTPLFMLTVAPALAIQTLTEEVVFRGFITQGLARAFKRPAVACLVSGLMFGAAHIPNGTLQAAMATVFGVVLAFMALETGGLALGWGLHLVNNLFGAIVIVSTGDVFNGAQGLFRQDTPGLNGFDFLFNVATLVLAAWLLLRRVAPPAESPG
ncbi:MAG: CPBP family intramembrane glutamic endopeptidase [Caulobacteraceae bacterium]